MNLPVAKRSPLQPLLDAKGVVILDGALATELERRGADLGDPLWSAKLLLENPELIRQVHLDYFRAGADVAISASYQATFQGFAQRGLDPFQAAEVMRLSVRLAQQAREQFLPAQGPLVAASIGCYGASLHDGSEYRGDYGLSRQQLSDWHRPRMEVLAHSGADLLACETIPCLVEAEALARLLEEFPDTPAWLSFSCQDGQRLRRGELLRDAIALANDCPNVVAAGVNCTPPQFVEDLLRSVSAGAKKPLLVYPNSGETWDPRAGCWRGGAEPTFDWPQAARRWQQAGAAIIGGCCRTTPETIRAIAETFS